jgi:hypothetical protein
MAEFLRKKGSALSRVPGNDLPDVFYLTFCINLAPISDFDPHPGWCTTNRALNVSAISGLRGKLCGYAIFLIKIDPGAAPIV